MFEIIIIGAAIFVVLLVVVCLITYANRVEGTYRIISEWTQAGDLISFGQIAYENHYYVLNKGYTGTYKHPVKGISGLIWKKEGKKIYMSHDGYSWSCYNKGWKTLEELDPYGGRRLFKKS